MTRKCEIGGDFHDQRFPQSDSISWPAPAKWFARGRDPVLALFLSKLLPASCRLFVPAYYCEDVTDTWIRAGIHAVRYGAWPEHDNIEFFDDSPRAGDVVLCVNFFGLTDMLCVREQIRAVTDALVIEDHTHDPVGNFALRSAADYCFSALRKSLPVTDGAILWSPIGHTLPRVAMQAAADISELGMSAMTLKKRYLESGGALKALKTQFRDYQARYHECFDFHVKPLKISTRSKKRLEQGYPASWRHQRQLNGAHLTKLVKEVAPEILLREAASKEQCPFVIVLHFADQGGRDRMRASFANRDIYLPVHWPMKRPATAEAGRYSVRMLSLPIDHRYRSADLTAYKDALIAGQ